MQERSVPVLVLSAGIADIIEEVFRQKLHRSFENIRVVSNRMVFYEKGHLVADKGLFMPVSKFMYKSASAKNWLSCWHFQHLITWKNEPPWDMAAPIQDRLKASNGLTRSVELSVRVEEAAGAQTSYLAVLDTLFGHTSNSCHLDSCSSPSVPALGPPPAPGREKRREERESSSHVTHARCHGKPSDRCRLMRRIKAMVHGNMSRSNTCAPELAIS
ncbi:YABBY protein [Musa troglodytarum]|uniref:5'-nucleotidase n=1 Tax=Musa troglodytarum TaxID=320322 RepID=A0A9E7GJZ2_9LILI|nr:YABBY protein [Musa troglodytarum]